MSDAVEDLIRDIAAKHGIAVGRDDPIMILHTINERLALENMRAQEQALAHFRSEIEMISQKWAGDAKDKAQRIVNATLQASQNSLQSALNETTKALVGSIQKELAATLAPCQASAEKASNAAWIAVGASILTALICVTLLLVG